MGMTASGMREKIQARLATTAQNTSEGAAAADPTNQLEAFCQGIIDEIQANAVASGTDSRGDSHSLDVD